MATEGWIVAGELDGVRPRPDLLDDVCGVPHVLRLACDLASAGVTRVYVIWNLDGPLPDLSPLAGDPRLASVKLAIARGPTAGDSRDRVVVVRSDRVFHRDMPKVVARAHVPGTVTRIRGHDAVFASDRALAAELVDSMRASSAHARALARCAFTWVAPPYAAFTARVSGPASLRAAERGLVRSLRKEADGLVAKAINRRISLPITYALARTRVHPNHISIVALACALAGGVTIASGGYLAAVIGMLLVELGSIIDGVDGELARLRYQFSRRGQWFDTVVDDLSTVAYVAGAAISLDAAGSTWVAPVAAGALACFALTQLTQYALIAFVYRSGDLAAIPWAYQSHESLARTGFRAMLPKLLKRDFAVTVFVVFAIAGRLDFIVAAFAAGAATFFVVFATQLVRHRDEIAIHRYETLARIPACERRQAGAR